MCGHRNAGIQEVVGVIRRAVFDKIRTAMVACCGGEESLSEENVEAMRRLMDGESVICDIDLRTGPITDVELGVPCGGAIQKKSSIVEPAEPDYRARRREAPGLYRHFAETAALTGQLARWVRLISAGEAFTLLVVGGNDVQRGAAACVLLDALAAKAGAVGGSFEDYHELEGSYRASSLYGGANDWALLEPPKNAVALAIHGIEAATQSRAHLKPLCEILRYRVSRLRPTVLTSPMSPQRLGGLLRAERMQPSGSEAIACITLAMGDGGEGPNTLVNLDALGGPGAA